MTTQSDARVEVHEDAAELSAAIAGELLSRIADLQAAGDVPQICLTGGTIAEAIHRDVARLADDSGVDWGAVDFWFGDERYVDPDSPDRNVGQAKAAFLDELGVPAHRIHEMASTSAAGSVDEGAEAYAAEVPERFDVMMLGVGPDGHIASLFPGFAQLDVEDTLAVGVTGSPKPPPHRISLTYPALRRGASVWFLVSGEGKAGAVASALGGADLHETPAAGVTGRDETIWFLDRAAASQL
ncbi:6-phosphogluconolactonase [Nocardioides sp. Kera G14]|uniref:6-phosphogluconolactonase n=1 Tax=Nocardioides sp. Kera G14 TaxID=2884264 RepID=UPI001D121FC4|nr:6-phosphogluconolactonase [Nocardioides sp. Kera G14]UDY25113.1 6-phosphogluconolactonase [Nocardioides sp. Kera G14]